MSIVLPLSAMLVALVGWAVGFLAYSIARKFYARGASAFAILSGFAVAMALFVPTLVLLGKASTTTLVDMDPREGERRLKPWGLPASTTSDFCYRHSFVGVEVMADFQMSEANFLRWMRTQNWTAVPFQIENDYDFIPVNGGAVGQADSVVYPVRQYEDGN